MWGPSSKNRAFLYHLPKPAFSSAQDREVPAIDAQGAPGAGIPTLGSRFPHTIKKHFVLNKTRQSIYIPPPGRTSLIPPA